MKMTWLCWIWVIFTVIFIMLAILNFIGSNKKVPKLQISTRQMENVTIKFAGTEIDEPLRNFITDFNTYIDNYNRSNSRQNIIACFGFIAAALVTLISLFLELKAMK